jgi:phage gp36-like protein
MGTYSEVADLILGDIPEPKDAIRWVQDATDEIDSKLGIRYVTPIIIDDAVPAYRSTALLLKRVNNWLASGRLIVAKAASGSENQMNAYGVYLLTQAESTLDQMMAGEMPLPGLTPIDSTDVVTTGPQINNLDAQSNVESFYTWVTTPRLSDFGDPFADQGFVFPGFVRGG